MRAGRRKMSPEVRHRVMASIRKRDTVPELTLRTALWTAGVRGWRCHCKLPGTPDLAFSRWRVAVFVDGVWWHGHPGYVAERLRGPYWTEKIAKNVRRDRAVNRELRLMGWSVVRIWDLEVLADPGRAAAKVAKILEQKGWRGAMEINVSATLPTGAGMPQRRRIKWVIGGESVPKLAAPPGTAAYNVRQQV